MRGPRVAAVLAFLAAACAAPGPALRAPADVDPEPVFRAWFQGREVEALARAEALGWRARHSIEGERVRQSLLLPRGGRGRLLAELAAEPGSGQDPDLLYLQARLLQEPGRLRRSFEELVDRFPGHAWIRLGRASLALGDGELETAAEHLRRAPDWPDARDFRLQVEARLLAARGKLAQALELLEEGAFRRHHRDLLATWEELAAPLPGARERVRAERAWLGRSRAETETGLLDRILERAVLAVGFPGRPGDLEGLLEELDRELQDAGLPAGLAGAPRYEVPLAASLVRPEPGASPFAAFARERGRFLLAGTSLRTGAGLLYLRDCRFHRLPWPGREAWVVLAGGGLSSFAEEPLGAAVFQGFYVRLDGVSARARHLGERAAALDPALLSVEAPRGLAATPGELPEDLDLPLRLRHALLQSGRSPAAAELEALLLHEAGHLPEVLSWLPSGPGLFEVLLPSFLSLLQDGDALVWLEYRAQLRALAALRDPRWALAEVVERARGPRDLYAAAYRRILRDLLEMARRRGLPEPASWDRLDPESLRALAAAVLEQEGLRALPPEVVRDLAGLAAETAPRLEAPPEGGSPDGGGS